jgi:hypothetical protein
MFQNVWFAFLLPVAPLYKPPSDGNIHKYVPHAFKCMYSVSHVATFLHTHTHTHPTIVMTCGVTLIFMRAFEIESRKMCM